MKIEIEQIITDHFDRKLSLGEAVTKILRLCNVSGDLPPVEDAVDFARWVRNNTITDGAPKIYLIRYEKVNKEKSRYTMEELYEVYKGGYFR